MNCVERRPVVSCVTARCPLFVGEREAGSNAGNAIFSSIPTTFQVHFFHKDAATMNMIRRGFIAGLAVAAMGLCTSSAKADIWGTSYATGNQSVVITDTGLGVGFTSGGQYAAEYGTTLASNSSGLNPTSYTSYCVDLTHETAGYTQLDPALPLGQLPTVTAFPAGTTVASDDPSFGRAAWIADTYGRSPANDVTQAAVQIAIWKAMYETNSSDYANLSAGSITFSSMGTGVATLAASYLSASLSAGGGSNFAIDQAQWVNYLDSDGSHPQFQLMPVWPAKP